MSYTLDTVYKPDYSKYVSLNELTCSRDKHRTRHLEALTMSILRSSAGTWLGEISIRQQTITPFPMKLRRLSKAMSILHEKIHDNGHHNSDMTRATVRKLQPRYTQVATTVRYHRQWSSERPLVTVARCLRAWFSLNIVERRTVSAVDPVDIAHDVPPKHWHC